MGTPSHSIGRPPHCRGTGKPPKLIAPSSPDAFRRSYSLGPTKMVTRPSQACPGAIVGEAVTAMVARPTGSLAFDSHALSSPYATSVKPPVCGTSAAMYQTLPTPIHWPSVESGGILQRFSTWDTWPLVDQT